MRNIKINKWLLIIILLSPLEKIYAQESGIKFETGISWNQILEKAKAQHKYIFMDCYATWCGPCKWMSKNIFPQQIVGEYYNEHFINVAVQMDRTAKDDQLIKNWYAFADSIGSQYNIGAYPTYLFFDSDGRIIHRILGVTQDPKQFI